MEIEHYITPSKYWIGDNIEAIKDHNLTINENQIKSSLKSYLDQDLSQLSNLKNLLFEDSSLIKEPAYTILMQYTFMLLIKNEHDRKKQRLLNNNYIIPHDSYYWKPASDYQEYYNQLEDLIAEDIINSEDGTLAKHYFDLFNLEYKDYRRE